MTHMHGAVFTSLLHFSAIGNCDLHELMNWQLPFWERAVQKIKPRLNLYHRNPRGVSRIGTAPCH